MWHLNCEMLASYAIGIWCCSQKDIRSKLLGSPPSPVTESLGDFGTLAWVSGLLLFSTLPSPGHEVEKKDARARESLGLKQWKVGLKVFSEPLTLGWRHLGWQTLTCGEGNERSLNHVAISVVNTTLHLPCSSLVMLCLWWCNTGDSFQSAHPPPTSLTPPHYHLSKAKCLQAFPEDWLPFSFRVTEASVGVYYNCVRFRAERTAIWEQVGPAWRADQEEGSYP